MTKTEIGNNSAFLADIAVSDAHIVDRLIEERCPTWVDHWSWPVMRRVIHFALGYKKAKEIADVVEHLTGAESFDYLAGVLQLNNSVTRFDRIPKTGRLVVAANHPTGLADGIAVWEELRKVRPDVLFFANADALRCIPKGEDIIIPVEWVIDKRSPAKTRETLKRARAAFEAEQCIVIFPSGKLAQKKNGKMIEHDWLPTAVSLARKYNAPIAPLNVQATNSWLYYTLSGLNNELRDITLFNELLNKKGDHFDMTCGPIIAPEALSGDALVLTNALKDYVSYAVAENCDSVFNGAEPS